MPEEFNPYHKWLSIPPQEQPPHHYRLLGLSPFESDADVIESAADRQMAHIQTYKTGKYSDLSQRLLNEVTSAKLTLLNKQKKQAYDAKLRQLLDKKSGGKSGIGAAGAKPKPKGQPKPRQAANAAPKIVVDDTPRATAPSQESSPPTLWIVAGGAGVVGLLIIGTLVFLMLGGPEDPVVVTPEPPVDVVTPEKKNPPDGGSDTDNGNGNGENEPPVKPPPVEPPPVEPPIKPPPIKPPPIKPPPVEPPTKDPPKKDPPKKDPPKKDPDPPKKLTAEQVAEQTDALQQQRSAAQSASQFKQLAADSLTLARKANEAGHKDAALEVSKLALIAARKSGDAELIRQATLLVIAIQEGKTTAAPASSLLLPMGREVARLV